MFKLEKPLRAVDETIRQDSSKSIAVSVSNIIEELFCQPQIIAYSGLVNDEVRLKAKEAGFKMVIESPLTV